MRILYFTLFSFSPPCHICLVWIRCVYIRMFVFVIFCFILLLPLRIVGVTTWTVNIFVQPRVDGLPFSRFYLFFTHHSLSSLGRHAIIMHAPFLSIIFSCFASWAYSNKNSIHSSLSHVCQSPETTTRPPPPPRRCHRLGKTCTFGFYYIYLFYHFLFRAKDELFYNFLNISVE